MRTKILSSLALLASLLTVVPVLAAEAVRSGHPVFDRAVQLVISEFYDAAALDRFKEAVQREVEDPLSPLGSQSPEERVDAAIDTILASLRVSHTGRFRPDSIAYFELADIFRFAFRDERRRLFPPDGEVSYPGVGMIAAPSNGLWFVSDVYDGSPAARSGIRIGDEIVAVDGAEYQEIRSFADKVGDTVDIQIRRRPDAQATVVKVKVERLKPLPMFEKAIADSANLVERNDRKIGYIRLWTLAAPRSMAVVAEALAEGPLKDADGLVLDLRGRWGGGNSDAAELFVGDTPSFRLVERNGETMLANVRWNKPVVAIIDEGTRSGLEVFAYAMRVNGVPLVGAQTAGALLAGRAFLLPDDSLLEIAVTDAIIGDDVQLEGAGVKPDIPVTFPLPYAAGRDTQRDAAVEEMLRLLARR